MPEINYDHHKQARATYSQKVIDSTSSKRLVMAGPGTGKSHLFKEVAKDLINNGKTKILVLTFINELVKDLAVEMHNLAEVSTLHSFAAKRLSSNQQIYVDLLKIVEDDLLTESDSRADMSAILHNLKVENAEIIEFLSNRRNYYKAYDPSSIVYELVKLYEQDASKIPQYDLILVDEYQDFNQLEARLIELLATKSSVLIAGDDDQSLYSFKHSKPENIREMYSSDAYEIFELPYCSRSTNVVIDAFHDFVTKAKSEGHLASRIEKQYLYFPDPDKDLFSEEHPKIVSKKQVYDGKNAYEIDMAIKDIFKYEPKFDVLIICSLKQQIKPLAERLRKKGYSNVSGDESTKNQHLAEGLRFLVADKESNLGWRLCSESLMENDALRDAIIKSKDCQTAFIKCLPSEVVTEVKKLRAIAVRLEKVQSLTEEQRELLFNRMEIDPSVLAENNAREKIFNDRAYSGIHSSVKLKITTILGSKGLSYDYVFMVNFDNQYLIPSGGIDDESISKFLVALTRSRKKIFIYTSKNTESTFASWINTDKKVVS